MSDTATRADNVALTDLNLDLPDGLAAAAEDAADLPPETVRFIVGGEPFDLPWRLLANNWADTGLFGAARHALRRGEFDIHDKYDSRVVLVRPEVDIRSFRAISSYIRTLIPVIPPDPVDRHILAADANFLGVTGLVLALTTGRVPAKVVAVPPAPIVVTSGARAVVALASASAPAPLNDVGGIAPTSFRKPGHAAPSAATVSEIVGHSRERDDDAPAGKKSATFLEAGDPRLEDFTAADSALLGQERQARLAFGEGEDATDLVRKFALDLFAGVDEPLTAAADAPDYQRLVYPGLGAPIPGAIPMVKTEAEFRANFEALTLGVVTAAIRGLPLVAAGGAVLAALHAWRRGLAIPDKIQEAYAMKMASMASDVSGGAVSQAITRQFIVECAKKGVTRDYGGRWRRRATDDEDKASSLQTQLTALKKQLGAAMPTLDSTASDALSLLAGITGVKWDSKGRLRPLSFREEPEEEEPAEVVDHEALAAAAAAAEVEREMAEFTRGDAEADLEQAILGSLAGGGRADNVGLTAGFLNGATLFSAAVGIIGGPAPPAEPTESSDYAAETAEALPDPSAAAIAIAARLLVEKGEEQRDRTLKSFRGTDVDLFLTTRSVDEAVRAIVTLFSRIRRCVPKSMAIDILRTNHSVTFTPPWPFRPVQVILRLYHSIEQVLLGFDLDCCAFAFDGRRVLALPRAVRAVQVRGNMTDPSRQSLTYEARHLKYTKRNFACLTPGAQLRPNIVAVESLLAEAQMRRAYARLTGVNLLLAMLIAVERRDRDLTRMLGVKLSDYGVAVVRLRRSRRFRGEASEEFRPPYVCSPDTGNGLHAVLFTNQGRLAPRYGAPITFTGTAPPIVTFVQDNPGAQGREKTALFSGSFHPSTGEWFALPADDS